MSPTSSHISSLLLSLRFAQARPQRLSRHYLFAGALLLSLYAGLSPNALADEVHVTWDCEAGSNNQWLCNEEQIITSNRNRPARTKPASIAASDEPRVAAVRNLDWLEEEQMTEEQRLKIEGQCPG